MHLHALARKQTHPKGTPCTIMLSTSPLVGSSATAPTISRVFEIGDHETHLLTVAADSDLAVPPPKPLLIASPGDAGEYPVIIFIHGYLLRNSFYSQLIQHVASHGFIVVAPQLYTIACNDCTKEINSTAQLTNWLPEGLGPVLPPQVRPNLSKLALSGHSRGGKVAFALALRKSLPFSALIGVDPVDGLEKGKQTPPPVLTYVPGSFDLGMPVMVVGAGLGEVKKCLLVPACAPRGVNHENFFKECCAPACHFVPRDYGHMDMLDDDTKGVRGMATHCLCKNGLSREPMRRFVGGIIVAFLKAYLGGDDVDLISIKDGSVRVPLELEKVEFLTSDE